MLARCGIGAGADFQIGVVDALRSNGGRELPDIALVADLGQNDHVGLDAGDHLGNRSSALRELLVTYAGRSPNRDVSLLLEIEGEAELHMYFGAGEKLGVEGGDGELIAMGNCRKQKEKGGEQGTHGDVPAITA